jgi:hypothetical protein
VIIRIRVPDPHIVRCGLISAHIRPGFVHIVEPFKLLRNQGYY